MSNYGAVHQEVTRIPEMDGTGPKWLGERKFYRRGRWNFPGNTDNLPGYAEPVQHEEQKSSDQKPVYGVGRGGLPRGCGRRMSRRWN